MSRPFVLSLCCLAAAASPLSLPAADAPTGHQPQVFVSEPTRLDWVFALANQSPAEAPAEWLKGYESKQQRYELFVPPEYDAKDAYPVVLFISAGGNPAGWGNWEAVCRQQKIIFASPHEAGNNTRMERRVRIVLDVLDDLRRRYHVDPDRTYLAGFSGGGRVACAIAFALPEYFGGVIPVCAGGDLRDEPWLRQRVVDRLSVASVTGDDDFNRGEVERFRGPLLAGVGVRAKVWTVAKMGHGIPDSRQFAGVFDWLEKGAAARRESAERYPALRIATDKPLDRQEWSQALFAEAQGRLKARETLYLGLMQMKGVSIRWADLPAGIEAKRILEEYEARKDRPWEQDDIAEQRRSLIARARALDAYASGDLPPQYAAMRSNMVAAAVQLWQLVIQDGHDAAAVAEAKRRIPELRKQ